MKVLTLEMIKERNLRQKKRSLRKKQDFNSFDSSDYSCASINSDSSSCTSSEEFSLSSSSSYHRNHSKNNHQQRYHHYVGMDCEMVGIGHNGEQSMLARVTIIDGNGKVLFDKYVKPTCKVTDYRTFVSGILPKHLEEKQQQQRQQHGSKNARNLLPIATCRARVIKILRNKILVGHALQNDLNALGISHPWHQTRDTAEWGPFMKMRFNDGVYWPRKLKDLVRENLKYEIQTPGKPHCPHEDAMAALRLYRCVQQEWEQEIARRLYNEAKYNLQQCLNNEPNNYNSNHHQYKHYDNDGHRQ